MTFSVEIRAVYHGWRVAKIGPGDEVEYTISDDETKINRYAPVSFFMRVYDCLTNGLNSHEYPLFISADIEQNSSVRISISGSVLHGETNEVISEFSPALSTIFQSLDENSEPGERAAVLEEWDSSGYLTEPSKIYEEVRGGTA